MEPTGTAPLAVPSLVVVAKYCFLALKKLRTLRFFRSNKFPLKSRKKISLDNNRKHNGLDSNKNHSFVRQCVAERPLLRSLRFILRDAYVGGSGKGVFTVKENGEETAKSQRYARMPQAARASILHFKNGYAGKRKELIEEPTLDAPPVSCPADGYVRQTVQRPGPFRDKRYYAL
ncbi:hypothetical protein NQ317_000985 [Molorchus minor]|uniref:Uncharacterized protein n=1 Tax=Molorchus minor TaxID=1323400 RepID=A0ABQ9JR33_9CUCU|nr:hypothetical protein NQ317_000985 [Molorchus minor]